MLVALQHISYGFGGRASLINDLSFSLQPATLYALTGPNGAGKTTLFNIISGFLTPQKGTIVARLTPDATPVELQGLAPFRINRYGISRTFQEGRLIGGLTVVDNIVLAMQPSGDSTQRKREKAAVLARSCFLDGHQEALAARISWGQQKLLSLACCLANNGTLVLLDEPVAGVAAAYIDKIALLLKQWKEQGKTVLFIEHHADFIRAIADEVYSLNETS